jgi:uncharacterized protein YcbK (DUF882 family)
LYTSAHALPVAACLFLVSCSSTGSNLDVAASNLQAGLVAPQPISPNQIANADIPEQSPASATPSTTLGFNAPQQPIVSPAQTVVSDAPDAAQLEKNSKLVSAAALAASANVPANITAPTISTPSPTIAQATTVQIAPAQSAATPQAIAQLPSTGKSAAVTATTTAPASNETAAAEAGAQLAKTAILTSAPPEQQIITAAPEVSAPVKKKTLFDTLFASNKKSSTASTQTKAEVAPEPTQLALAAPEPSITKTQKVAVEPVLQPAKLDLSKLEEPQAGSQTDEPVVDNGELPGVRKGALFEIKRRDSLQDDTDVDIGETDSGPILLASAAGLARLAPNGLKVQRESVDVACLKPQLVKILKKIERHYSSSVVVTSGFRSPGYNRRVRGAKNSLHMFCAAADIQVVGVSKWELARYARSMAGRGGVGTYCHTDSIHIDVGPDRDWNWRCSRRK